MTEAQTIALDDLQRRVVEHDGGPLLVLGSPGTGKTKVLVERWVRLATAVTTPHRVLLLVPTRDRALALRDQLPWRVPGRALVEVPVHTWYALAYHLVTRYHRRLGYDEPPVRLTNPEQWSVVRDLLASEDPADWEGYGEQLTTDAFVNEVADFCIRAGHRGLADDDLLALASSRPSNAAVARFAVRYRNVLSVDAALDYPGLVLEARRLLDEADDIREALHRRFTHVLVDDAQELAPAQLGLLRRLNLGSLVCAGDPDSAIEAFRGADPGWLDRFADVAPGHQTVALETSHRFGKSIGAVADRLISHGEPADHRAASFAGPDDGAATLRCYGTMAGEIEAAARTLRAAHLDGVPYERMAVLLTQPGTYLHPLGRMLESLDVPYRVDSGDRPLGAEPSVAAVLDLCRAAFSDGPDDELVKRVLAGPLVGMHPHTVRELARDARMRRGTSLAALVSEDDSAEASEYRRLCSLARADVSETADATFLRIFDESSWCMELIEDRRTDPEAAHHLEALSALARALGHFVERHPHGTMQTYLASSAEAGFAPERWTPSRAPRGVHVMSLHASKGLEWDVVCVLGVAEGQIPKPHRAHGLFDPWALELGSAVDRALAQLAEERRTLYVAMTRACRQLVVSTSPGTRRAAPSRFLQESFGELPETIIPGDEGPPLTLSEAASRLRRVLASEVADGEKAAAAAALARIPGVDPGSWWWRREWTPGAPLRPEGTLVTSYSRISRYDDCPLRYVLESVLGLDPSSTYQMKFGSLVHRIFERADPAADDITTLEDAIAEYKKEFVEQHKDDYPNVVFARTYYTFGVQCIKRWWRTERNAGETVAIEYSFDDLELDGHTIRGRIDRVARGPKGLVLSDYKTSRSPLEWDKAKESLQLAIYYLAAKTYPDLKQYGDPAVMQLIYPGLGHTSKFDGSEECAKRYQKPEDAETAIDRLKEMLAKAAAEDFAPSPEADCRWCRMKPLCPRWPEGKEIPS